MTAHAPALQVLVALLCAPLCAAVRARTIAWLLFLVAAAASLAAALAMALQVLDGRVLRYAMGGWAPPVGIEYVIDGANVAVLVLVSGIALVVAAYGRRSIEAEIEERRIPLFYACLCLFLAGMLGVAATGDAFNLFVFLEIGSLASYALIAMGGRRRALLAAFQYLTIGTIGSTFLLIGVGLAYAVTGTLNMADLADRLPELYGNRAVIAAVVFVFIGLGVKMAMFPLHAWLPGAYAEAPSAVSLFLGAIGTKVAIYAFVRFAFTVFGEKLVFDQLPVGRIGLLLASLAMLVGSAAACFQSDFKRLLAWSSVGQIGYIIAGFSLASAAGLTAAYLHVINHAVIKGAMFAAAGIVLLRLGSASLVSLSGMGRTRPWTFAPILVAGLGLIGVPPTAGFVSKWALARALIEQGRVLVLVVLLVSSLLAMVYVGRVVEIGWFRAPTETAAVEPPPPSMAAATWLLVLVSLYFGVDATWPGALAEHAAATLLGDAG